MQKEIENINKYLWEKHCSPDLMSNIPILNPVTIEKICEDAGSPNIFKDVLTIMEVPGQSNDVRKKNKNRAINIINTMMFGQSQKCSWYQHIQASFLRQHGLSDTGLTALWQEGVSVHPRTARLMSMSINESYKEMVKSFIDKAKSNGSLLVFMVDDYTNIHTKHRPTSVVPTVVSHKATLLLKCFDNIKAIPADQSITHNPSAVDIPELVSYLRQNMPLLCNTFASTMPSWIREKFFDPEWERNRLAVHDYQEFENIRVMRSMDNTVLIDSIELPLKSYDNFLQAVQHAVDMGLGEYLKEYLVFNPGDWPAQYYLQQIVNQAPATSEIRNVVPFLGALHESLNGRENPLHIFIEFFKAMYKVVFGEKKILADHPKPWRGTYLIQIAYGG